MKYKIRLSNGEMVQIIADSDEEALQMAKEIEQQKISQGEFSVLKNGDSPPDMDRLNFNYQKGVALPGLRAALGFAEGDLNGLEEKEQYLVNKVGSQGFTRDSKGNLALTPKGLIRLGITVRYHRTHSRYIDNDDPVGQRRQDGAHFLERSRLDGSRCWSG